MRRTLAVALGLCCGTGCLKTTHDDSYRQAVGAATLGTAWQTPRWRLALGVSALRGPTFWAVTEHETSCPTSVHLGGVNPCVEVDPINALERYTRDLAPSAELGLRTEQVDATLSVRAGLWRSADLAPTTPGGLRVTVKPR